jgi:hypothetical protein
MAPKAKPKPSV